MAAPGSSDAASAGPDRIRTHAVHLYCRELCGSERMALAQADTVASISPADAWGGDEQLLRLTRVAAARHAPRRPDPADGERSGSVGACAVSPPLLARRANGELAPAQQSRLEDHLTRCLFCLGLELRERRASRAFRAVIATADPKRLGARPAEPDDEPVVLEPDVIPAATEPTVAPEEPGPAAEPDGPEPDPPGPVARRGFVVFPAGGVTARRTPQAQASRRKATSTRLRDFVPFLATLAVGAIIVVVVALLLGGSGVRQNAAALLPPPSPASIPPAAVGVAAAQGTRARAATAQQPAPPHR